MNWIDAAVLIILAISAITGFVKGFVIELTSLAGFVLGIYLSLRYAGAIERILFDITGANTSLLYFLAFALCFVVVVIFVHFLGKSIEKIVKIAALGFLNRLGGAFFSIAKSLLFFAVIFHLLTILDRNDTLISAQKKEESRFFKPMAAVIPGVMPLLRDQVDKLKKDQETPEEQPVQTAFNLNGNLYPEKPHTGLAGCSSGYRNIHGLNY